MDSQVAYLSVITAMSLLPTRMDRTVAQAAEVVGLDDEGGVELLEALSSETARKIVLTLNEEPKPANEVAQAIGTSLQNTTYHLKKLENSGVIRSVGTEYSEKGREMNVYAPSSQPLVIVSASDTGEVRNALTSASPNGDRHHH